MFEKLKQQQEEHLARSDAERVERAQLMAFDHERDQEFRRLIASQVAYLESKCGEFGISIGHSDDLSPYYDTITLVRPGNVDASGYHSTPNHIASCSDRCAYFFEFKKDRRYYIKQRGKNVYPCAVSLNKRISYLLINDSDTEEKMLVSAMELADHGIIKNEFRLSLTSQTYLEETLSDPVGAIFQFLAVVIVFSLVYTLLF